MNNYMDLTDIIQNITSYSVVISGIFDENES